MLRQSLKGFAASHGLEASELIAAAGLEPTLRAEEVDIAGFVRLARAVGQGKPAGPAQGIQPALAPRAGPG